MTIDGGSNLIATTSACDPENGVGDALVPAFSTAEVLTGSAHIVLAGSAMSEIEVEWSQRTNCASGPGTSTLAGASRFTFLPDGHLTRYDAFQLTGTDLDSQNGTCACAGSAVQDPLALTAYTTFVGSAINVSDEDGSIADDPTLQDGRGSDTDSNLCLVDDAGTPQILFGFPFPDSSYMRMGRHRVHSPEPGAVSFILDYLDPTIDFSAPALPADGSNYSDSVIAVDMYLMPAGTEGTCKAELNDIYQERAQGAQLDFTNTDLTSYQWSDKDHVFGGEESEGHFAPINGHAGQPITMSVSDGAKIATGIGVLITFDTAPVKGSVLVRRPSDQPFVISMIDDHRYALFIGGGMAFDDKITIVSEAP